MVGAGTLFLALEADQKTTVKEVKTDVRKMWDTLYLAHIQKRPAVRYNAYNTLLSIRKLPDDSLPAVISKVESAL